MLRVDEFTEIEIDGKIYDVDDVINAYVLSLFDRYRDTDVGKMITFEVKATAYPSARELSVTHEVRLGYGDEKFVSASLATSLDRVLNRVRESIAHEVKALPPPSLAPDPMPVVVPVVEPLPAEEDTQPGDYFSEEDLV
jgi:hypothetical protein